MNLNGNHYQNLHWPDNPAEELLDENQWNRIAQLAALTPRELEVAELLFQGLTRNQIAERLLLQPRTVRQYMENLHSKFQVTNRIGLVLRVVSLRDQLNRK